MSYSLVCKRDSRTNTSIAAFKAESSRNVEKSASAVPIYPSRDDEEKTQLKNQISAPCYFFSLLSNFSPPYEKLGREQKPKLLIGTIVREIDAVELITVAETDPVNGLNDFLGRLLVNKHVILNHNLSEKKFLVNFLKETIDYAAEHQFNASRLACLLTIYLSCHIYFQLYYWTAPSDVWTYFKELMLRHSIEDSPSGQDVFGPEECYDIITHFHTMYITNLPLIHILTFGVYRVKYVWSYKIK